MAKKKLRKAERPKVLARTANGNLFELLGLCRAAASKAGWTDAQWNAVFREATLQQNFDAARETLSRYFVLT